MLTISDSLRAMSLYPINPVSLQNMVEDAGLTGDEEATQAIRKSSSYRRAKANVLMYLALAPAVSEAGATYSFTEDERKMFRKQAQALMQGVDDADAISNKVGYVGEDF